MVLDKGGKVVRMLESGTGSVYIAATKMLPEAQIRIKMIASMAYFKKDGDPGVMIYGSDFIFAGKSTHYGRMFRYISVDDRGLVSLGDELHKKGHPTKIPMSILFNNDRKGRQEFLVPMSKPPMEDLLDRTDDQ
jgi:hypothetical protein